MGDRAIVLLFLAQVLGFPMVMPFVAFAFDMYISTILYCCLANYTLLLFGFYSPLYLAACFLNLLGNFLANFTGAWPRDFPDVFYGSGYGYEDDAGEYCWYLLGWIWEHNARLFACCVLFGFFALVAILIPLNLKVAKKVRALRISNNGLRARIGLRQEKNRLVKESIASMEENAARVRESCARAEENMDRAKANAARLEQQRTAELQEQSERLQRLQTRTADRNRRGVAMGERERRAADFHENITRQRAAIAEQERIATEDRFEAAFQENFAEVREQIVELQEDVDRMRTAGVQARLLLADAADALDVDPASLFEGETWC